MLAEIGARPFLSIEIGSIRSRAGRMGLSALLRSGGRPPHSERWLTSINRKTYNNVVAAIVQGTADCFRARNLDFRRPARGHWLPLSGTCRRSAQLAIADIRRPICSDGAADVEENMLRSSSSGERSARLRWNPIARVQSLLGKDRTAWIGTGCLTSEHSPCAARLQRYFFGDRSSAQNGQWGGSLSWRQAR